MSSTNRTEDEMDVTIAGVAETLRELRQFDPEARKQFAKDAKQIAMPAIQEIQAAYPVKILSGMTRNWSQKGRKLFPYDAAIAKRRVGIKIDASRKAKSVISIIQRDPAASIIEFAGKRPNALGAALSEAQSHHLGRIAWPAADRKVPEIEAEMERSVRDVMNRVARRIA